MNCLSILLRILLIVPAIIAAPLTSERQGRHESRQLARTSNRAIGPIYLAQTDDSSNERWTTNWAGAELISTGFTVVTAEVTVPTPRIPPHGNRSTQYCASAWVGIDGDTCRKAILQTGIDMCIQGNEASFSAWYEWYPKYAIDFTHIKIAEGDVIKMTVNATSKTSGTAIIENKSTGQKVSHTFNGPAEVGSSLCEYNAEWIVEDFISGSSLVPFVDFGNVTFHNARAFANGTAFGPSGANIFSIMQKGVRLTSSFVTSDSVTVKYVS